MLLHTHHACKQTFSPSNKLHFPSAADWDLALGVNVKGYAFGLKHASLAMTQQLQTLPFKDKSDDSWPFAILNISSTGGVSAVPNMVPYISTKGAVIAMTKSCAMDLAKHKIR